MVKIHSKIQAEIGDSWLTWGSCNWKGSKEQEFIVSMSMSAVVYYKRDTPCTLPFF